MKRIIIIIACLLLLAGIAAFSYKYRQHGYFWMLCNYSKRELYITMRDGTRLYTALYEPRFNFSKHPLLFNRTPYGIHPYGGEMMDFQNTHYLKYMMEGYIFVFQDVRGRGMSDGQFVNLRPYLQKKTAKSSIDESTDSWDTIDWLLSFTHCNGNVGVWGPSYTGFYATMAALCGHPALKIVSPQAPVTDWWKGDDLHHNGAFFQYDAFWLYTLFFKDRPYPTQITQSQTHSKYYSLEPYSFYLNVNTFDSLSKLVGDSISMWNDIARHPDYDSFWLQRNVRNFVQNIPEHTAVLVVGGLFDAENCYGAWNLYKAIAEKTKCPTYLAMGPWLHQFWAWDDGSQLGNIKFGSKTSQWYQDSVEFPLFNYYLKGEGNISNVAKVNVFNTGQNQWRHLKRWPAQKVELKNIYLQDAGNLSFSISTSTNSFSYYTSDPANPVPYTGYTPELKNTRYMTDDQSFTTKRKDVLSFSTSQLQNDITITGSITTNLFASISTTDADFIVKIIDVFPVNTNYIDSIYTKEERSKMTGYQMLVRGEVLRGKYRSTVSQDGHPELVSGSLPLPFKSGQITEIKYSLPDIAHTFKKGHRIMVQIQSTWFPLVDRNPQQFMNIYKAKKTDYIKSDIRIYHDKNHPSSLLLPILNE